MSWPTWTTGSAPIPTAMAAPVQSTIVPAAINSAPAVIPPGIQYSPEQWAQAQQHNWQQWAQWQQQYQQWHQQYGAEYQKSMSALQGLTTPQQPPLPVMPNTGVPPPLPVESKPPLPPEEPPISQSSYSTMPPKPNQGYTTAPPPITPQIHQIPPQIPDQYYSNQRQTWQPNQQNLNKRPFSQDTEYEPNKRPLLERPKQWSTQQQPNVNQWTNQPPPNFTQQPPPSQPTPKPNIEELSEAEKKFDKEFAAWEAQFNKWKEQNANHPDKTQYLEYEKKWESWRNSLLERREQMRRKRLAMTGAAIGVNKSSGFTTTTNMQKPPPEPNRPSGGFPVGPTKPPMESPVRQQSLTPHLTDKPPNLPNIPPPHQNNEPLSFKPSQASSEISGESFLKSFSTSGGIPGLDLVKEDEANEVEKDVIELDKEEKKFEEPAKRPDLDAISKGINTILGDQKLLNMLSIVSQNPPSVPPPNIATNSVSNIGRGFPQEHNFNAPPPPHQFTEAPPTGNFNAPPSYQPNEGSHQNLPHNEQSNHSYEERSNHGDNHQLRESVNNFDDQTRSSFTIGPNDQDVGYSMTNYPHRNQLNKPPPNKFGGVPPRENERGNLRSNFGPGPGRFNDPSFPMNMPDNRNKFGALRGNNGPGHFNDNFKQNDFRGNNLQTEDFNRQSNYQNDFSEDNYSNNLNSRNNFRQNNFGSKTNFDDRRGNFDRSDKFNEPRRDDYRRNKFDQGGYDEYENYEEDDDYDKYHEMFNEDDQKNDNLHPKQGQATQGSGQQFGKVPQQLPRLMDLPTEKPPELVEPVPEEEPIFEPTTVVDYDHKSLRTAEPDVVVEPIHMFDYRHKPLNRIPLPQRPKWLSEAVKFIREFDPLVPRGPLIFERPADRYPLGSRETRRDDRRSDILEDRYNAAQRSFEDRYYKGRDRRYPSDFDSHSKKERKSYDRNDDLNYSKVGNRRPPNTEEEYFERDTRGDDKSHKFEDNKLSDKNFEDFSDDEINFENHELKKHQESRDIRCGSQSPILSNPPNPANISDITMIEDIINAPGRFHRPPRIVIILRGPPGSGKTYLAKLIKDKEVENGGSAPRILSLDDYFMVEHEKEVVEDGKKVTVKEMVYEFEADMEDSYRSSFIKSFKKTVTDGYFPFIIVDNVNDKVKYFGEMWSFAKQNGFQVYICQLDLDPALCTKRNIHNRSEAEIEECIAGWEPTPNHHPTIDASGFLQSSITDVEMEEVGETVEEENKPIEEAPEDEVRSKWDTFDCSINNLAKLDGINKPLRSSRTMEEYLQMEDEWEAIQPTKPGEKRVRWADLEEQRQQKKMRAIGFIVGHTNWNRMMDPTEGGSALTQTKYI